MWIIISSVAVILLLALAGWVLFNILTMSLFGMSARDCYEHDRRVEEHRREQREKAAKKQERLEKRAAKLGCTVEDLSGRPVKWTPRPDNIDNYFMCGVFDEQSGQFLQRTTYRGRRMGNVYQFFYAGSQEEVDGRKVFMDSVNAEYHSVEELADDLRGITTFKGKKIGWQTRRTLYSEPGSDWSEAVPLQEQDTPTMWTTVIIDVRGRLPAVTEWLNNNCVGEWSRLPTDKKRPLPDCHYRFAFQNEADAIQATLQWGTGTA